MANYKKRADGRYARQVVVGVKPDGKPERKTIYGKTLKELDKNYREFMALKDRGVILQNADLTFAEVAEMWAVNEKKPDLKPQSYEELQMRIRGINEYIGCIKANKLTLAHLESLKTNMIEKKYLARYNQYVSDIRNVLRYAMAKDIVYRNVAEGMKRVKRQPARKRALTEAELQAFKDAKLTEKQRVLIDLLLYTGMRRNEIMALCVSDIDVTKKVIRVHKTLAPKNNRMAVQDTPKTDAGNRKIPILVPLSKTLIPYLQKCDDHLFLNNWGNLYNNQNFTDLWKNILKAVKAAYPDQLAEDITPHIFRHTYASSLYKAGLDTKTAQYLLGHSDIKTTLDVYTHFGYQDIPIAKLEGYYDAVKIQSSSNIITLKAL